MIVYFSCGRVILKEHADPSRAVELGRLVHRPRDLAHGALVDEGVERDVLPRHHEDDHAHGKGGLPEPVLGQQRDVQPGAEAEVRVEQGLVGDGDGRRAQQEGDEEQHRQELAVPLVPGEEHPEEDAQRGLHRPRQGHDHERHPERVQQARVGEDGSPALEAGGPDHADAVPCREAEEQDGQERHDGERDEDEQGRKRHPDEGAAPPAPRGRAPRSRRGGRSDRRHCPMTWFMLEANCCGVIDSWKSLAMLSSSFSAAVGLRAWSQDWAKTLALLAVS